MLRPPLFETFPLACPRCGELIRIISFVTDMAESGEVDLERGLQFVQGQLIRITPE